jgi:hypothetical protein
MLVSCSCNLQLPIPMARRAEALAALKQRLDATCNVQTIEGDHSLVLFCIEPKEDIETLDFKVWRDQQFLVGLRAAAGQLGLTSVTYKLVLVDGCTIATSPPQAEPAAA